MVKKKIVSKWTWREYALQLSVVIIGILVTFVGSDLLSRRARLREVRTTMRLVSAELETNRRKFQETWDWIQFEMQACRVLADNRHDLKRISPDTMVSFAPVYGRILSYHPRHDAFEVLKNSGLMASVSDKDFLLTVTQGYATLEELEENVSMYYKVKFDAQYEMSRVLTRSQRDILYSGGMYEMWECAFSVPYFSDFVLSAPYFFPKGYMEGLLADVDRAVQTIEMKYETDKKSTDD